MMKMNNDTNEKQSGPREDVPALATEFGWQTVCALALARVDEIGQQSAGNEHPGGHQEQLVQAQWLDHEPDEERTRCDADHVSCHLELRSLRKTYSETRDRGDGQDDEPQQEWEHDDVDGQILLGRDECDDRLGHRDATRANTRSA